MQDADDDGGGDGDDGGGCGGGAMQVVSRNVSGGEYEEKMCGRWMDCGCVVSW